MSAMLTEQDQAKGLAMEHLPTKASGKHELAVDAYFSADVETDGPIPGPFSILSFGLVYAGTFDGQHFTRPQKYDKTFLSRGQANFRGLPAGGAARQPVSTEIGC